MLHTSQIRRCVPVAFFLAFAGVPPATGQNGPPPPPAPTPGSESAGAPVEAAVSAPDTSSRLSEQSIYIPYRKLRAVFEREGRGVFLPYEQFRELWSAARQTAPPDPSRPPVDALISSALNEATVQRDVVHVRALLRIELLRGGWHQIGLGLEGAAIIDATIDDAPARIVHEPGAGYRLLHEAPKDGPRTLDLVLTYARAYTKAPGRNSVTFTPPRAPVNRWHMVVPEPGVKVVFHPLLAATEVPPAEDAAERTEVLAFIGPAPDVRIDWTARARGATGLDALAHVDGEQQIWIEQRVTRVRCALRYHISRAELTALTIEVPADQKVLNVADANVRQWSVTTEGDHQHIHAELFEPAREAQHIVVELERLTAQAEGGPAATEDAGDARPSLAVPVVRALDAARQEAVVVVRTADGLRVQVQRATGLIQMDPSELPAGLQDSAWSMAYRCPAMPFELRLAVEQVRPVMVVDARVEARLGHDRVAIDLHATYDIQRAGVFEVALDVPVGFEVRTVQGVAIGTADALAVDTHVLAEPDAGASTARLRVKLSQKAIGRKGLHVALSRRLDEPDLLTPTDAAVEIALPVPRAVDAAVQRETGRLIVRAPEALSVSPARVGGLRAVAGEPDDARAGAGRDAPDAAVLAFVYGADPVDLVLAVHRRRPYVSVSQRLACRIEPGIARYELTFIYSIRYSGVASLRIDVPAELATTIRNDTAGMREERIEPVDDEPPAGPDRVAWRFTGDRELLGDVQIRVGWESVLEELDVGKRVELPLPRLLPIGADRAWGQIVLNASQTIELEPAGTPEGVRPIDPRHDLMSASGLGRAADAARAWEFHGDWSLTVAATCYELAPIKRTSIERALVRVVVTRGDMQTVQALYRLRSARQRLRLELPAGATFDTQPLRLNGQPVMLERGGQDEYFAPLVGRDPDAPLLLELRYSLAGAGARVRLPGFPDEPAVQKVYLSTYLPTEQAWLGTRGAWTDDMAWRLREPLHGEPAARHSEDWLLAWVAEGVSASTGTGFQTDGRHHLFSTLRPVAGDDRAGGGLKLVRMRRTTLSLLVFGVVLAGGLALLRRRAPARWLAAGSFVVALVLLGVFLPTFCLRLMDEYLLAAVFAVLVIWLVHYLAWSRPRDPVLRARRAARLQAATASEAGRHPPPPPDTAAPDAEGRDHE